MCRTVLIFLLMDSSEFWQCFIYAKHNSSMIFRWARMLWRFEFLTSLKSNWTSPLKYFKGFFTFPQMFSLPCVARPWFFYSQIALGSDNVLDMQNITLRWFFAELESFEAKVFAKKGVKVRIFDVLKIRLNLYFLAKTFASKLSSSAKNHRSIMFYISKTLSEPWAICE